MWRNLNPLFEQSERISGNGAGPKTDYAGPLNPVYCLKVER